VHYLAAEDTRAIKKIGINVAALVGVAALLLVVAAWVT
jgi:hypothetical protein